MGSWNERSPELSDALGPTRLELHWAAQIPAAAARALVPAARDYSHTALTWEGGALRTAPLGKAGDDVALELADFSIRLSREGQREHLSLADRTVHEALRWLGERLGERLDLLDHDLPSHGVGRGEPFAVPDRAHLQGLSAWFANADDALREVTATLPNASPVRCWPHHFDIASLVSVGDGASIGVGMSPGDASYGSPYFYVTPWPYPVDAVLPSLSNGARWHTEGWVGAVFLAQELDREQPRAQVVTFFAEAFDACRAFSGAA